MQVRQRVEALCSEKHVSFETLEQIGTRFGVRNGGRITLAWATSNGAGVPTAVKLRELGGNRSAEPGSVFLEAPVFGKRDAPDWFVAEGETDAARLLELVGESAAVMMLPAGAKTFKREWSSVIPRGATVYLCHDADEAGDAGAERAAALIGGKTVRVRPPEGVKDWCDWDGGREQFVELVQGTRGSAPDYEFAPLGDFLEHPFPQAEPLIVTSADEPLFALGFLIVTYGLDGAGKSTFYVDLIAHLASGHDWLNLRTLRPVRLLVIENEGPPSMFQRKLEEKAATWNGDDWTHNVFAFKSPWGAFTFANPDARAALTDYCEQHEIEAVFGNPTLGLGVAPTGRPDETQQFVDWLHECGLGTTRMFALSHHENKAGQISGDWGRHPDTKIQLQADGKQPRTKLVWEKTRWATLPTDEQPKAVMLDWLVETKGYNVVELDTVGASDSELEQRVTAFLAEHPWSSTRSIWGGVKGTNDRIRRLLESDHFDCVKGPRGSILWNIASDRVGDADAPPTQ